MLTRDRDDSEPPARGALARVDALHIGLTRIALEGGDLDGIAAEPDLVDPAGRLRAERMDSGGVAVAGGEVRTPRVAAGGQNVARPGWCR